MFPPTKLLLRINFVIRVGCVHEDKEHGAKDFGFVWAAMFGRLLSDKRLTSQPHALVPNGLNGVQGALQRLMKRQSGNEKFVFR
jgi:NADPH2:quinone reductase